MATSVAATSREAAGTVPAAPWYRDRNRLLVAAAIAVAVIVAVTWFIVTSGKRKEEFAVAEPQPGAGDSGGGEPAACLERAAEADPDLQGH